MHNFSEKNKGTQTHTKVGILKKTDKVGFAGFLQGHHGRALKPQVGLEVLSNLADQTLERELANQQLGRLLIPEDKMVKRKTTFLLLWSPSDLSQGNSAWPVAMRLLNSTSGRSRLPCRLGGQLLPGKKFIQHKPQADQMKILPGSLPTS